MREILPSSAVIGQIAPTHFAAVLPHAEPLQNDRVLPFIEAVQGKYGGIPQLAVGIFTESDRIAFDKGRGEKVATAGALDLARYALIVAESNGAATSRFERSTPSSVMYLSRRTGNLSQAERDYEMFKKHHVLTANAENQLAIIYYENDSFEKAVEAIDRATELAPSDSQLWLNSGFMRYYNSDLDAAFTSFKKATDLKPDYTFAEPYLVPFVWTYIAALESQLERANSSEAIGLFDLALSEANNELFSKEDQETLRDLVNSLHEKEDEDVPF